MEELIGNFFDDFADDFLEYLEVNRTDALKERKDYKKSNKKIKEIKCKYPNVRTFIEEKEPVKLSDDEQYELLNILSEQENLETIELKEAFKLGFKEAIVYLNSMQMLKL